MQAEIEAKAGRDEARGDGTMVFTSVKRLLSIKSDFASLAEGEETSAPLHWGEEQSVDASRLEIADQLDCSQRLRYRLLSITGRQKILRIGSGFFAAIGS